jgi:hypothetical protein
LDGALQKDLAATAQCLLRCLLWCSQQEDPTAMAVVQHLLLEAIPSDPTATADTLNKQLAVQLMLLYASNGSGKLASKVGDTAPHPASNLMYAVPVVRARQSWQHQ